MDRLLREFFQEKRRVFPLKLKLKIMDVVYLNNFKKIFSNHLFPQNNLQRAVLV